MWQGEFPGSAASCLRERQPQTLTERWLGGKGELAQGTKSCWFPPPPGLGIPRVCHLFSMLQQQWKCGTQPPSNKPSPAPCFPEAKVTDTGPGSAVQSYLGIALSCFSSSAGGEEGGTSPRLWQSELPRCQRACTVGLGSLGFPHAAPKEGFWLLLWKYLQPQMPLGGTGGTGCFKAFEEELSRRHFPLPKTGILRKAPSSCSWPTWLQPAGEEAELLMGTSSDAI